MATDPSFAATIKSPTVQIATANSNTRDGTGTLGTVYTAGANGSIIRHIRVAAAGTTTLGMVRWFIDNGTNVRYIGATQVTAITVNATTEPFTKDLVPSATVQQTDIWLPLYLQATYILKASTEKSEAINIIVVDAADM